MCHYFRYHHLAAGPCPAHNIGIEGDGKKPPRLMPGVILSLAAGKACNNTKLSINHDRFSKRQENKAIMRMSEELERQYIADSLVAAGVLVPTGEEKIPDLPPPELPAKR
ncbi:MAG: hypothetical protein K8R07_01380 [Desulfobacterales bacterium]|nr:hypothetical protein [Desulfobacterales bacterium]